MISRTQSHRRAGAAFGDARISAPTCYGNFRLLPLLPAFRAKYPLIKVEAHISNRNIDFHEESFDVAIRFRVPPDSTMVSRRLEDAALVVVASPNYLKRDGAPRTLSDLEQHECIQIDLPSSGRQIAWLFNEDGHEKEIVSTGSYVCTEDALAGVTLAKAVRAVPTYRFIVGGLGRRRFGRGPQNSPGVHARSCCIRMAACCRRACGLGLPDATVPRTVAHSKETRLAVRKRTK